MSVVGMLSIVRDSFIGVRLKVDLEFFVLGGRVVL